jgi:hypothetical protein
MCSKNSYIVVFDVMTPCSLVGVHQNFIGVFFGSISSLHHLYPEDGSNVFIRNDLLYEPVYIVLCVTPV